MGLGLSFQSEAHKAWASEATRSFISRDSMMLNSSPRQGQGLARGATKEGTGVEKTTCVSVSG